MKNNFDIAITQPWKLVNEVLMYLLKPIAYIYLRGKDVEIGKNFKFYGLPKIFKTKGSRIKIGDNFENRNWWFSNPLGINHPLIICTWSENATIYIGNDVGISGGSIISNTKISIRDRVLIGANSTIIDTDFHPTVGEIKRYSKENIKTKEIIVGDDSFLGMSCVVLKGVNLKKNSIIPAGGVIR